MFFEWFLNWFYMFLKATHVFDMFVVGYLNCVHGMVSICVVF